MPESIQDPSSHQILIVDDEPTNIDVLYRLMKDQGYRVSVASDGPTALRVASASLPDLILLDIVMPVMDGYAICQELKQDHITSEIPVIFITGTNQSDAINQAFATGGTDYIVKPIRREEVLTRVKFHLERQMLLKRNKDLIGHLRDINLNLKSSQTRLHAIMDHVADGILVANSEGIIDTLNPAALKILGYSREEILSHTLDHFIHESNSTEIQANIFNSIKTGQGLLDGKRVELVGRRKDGSGVPLEMSLSQMILEENKYLVGIFNDISNRKLWERELISAREEAEQNSKAKSEFLSRMSHELRTPMNSILGFTQLMEMNEVSPLTGMQKQNLQRVSSAAHHLLSLIDEILDLSRIESGQLKVSLGPVDLNRLIDGVVSILKPMAKDHKISLKVALGDLQSIFVQADLLRLKQVLLNLVSNGIKYNKENGSVILSATRTIEGRIRINVQDTGLGISKEYQALVFQNFQRLGAESTSIEGTGIGLAITKGLVELMNGTIGFESEEGTGSCFYFELPAGENSHFSNKEAKEGNVVSIPKSGATAKKTTILYVEDNPVNIELMRQILSNRPQIELTVVKTAITGIQKAQALSPDLILMDIQLPDMDGLTAFKKLKDDPKTKDIPVIAITANAMLYQASSALDMGFAAYITKPIDVISFLRIIDNAI